MRGLLKFFALRQWPGCAFFLLILTVCFTGYYSVFMHGFLLDDHIVLFGQGGMVNKSLREVFSFHQGQFYRPVGHVVMWFCQLAFGTNPPGYHVVNILLLSGVGYLFFRLARSWGMGIRSALLACSLFILHPFNGFFVNYITASVILVFLLLLQGALGCFIRSYGRNGRWWLAASFALYSLALLSHESAVAFTMYLAAYIFFIRRGQGEPFGIRTFVRLCPFALLAVIFVLLRRSDFLFGRTLMGAGAAFRDPVGLLSTWSDLAGWYLTKLILPRDILFLQSATFNHEHLLLKTAVLAVGVAASGYLLFIRWRSGLKAFALALVLSGLLFTIPASFSYFPIVRPFFEPHWMAFSSFGSFILLSLLLAKVIACKRPLGLLAMVWILTFVLLSAWEHNRYWVNQETYSRYWLEHNRGNLTPFYGLGKSLMEKGDIPGALRVFLKGISTLNTNNVYILADTGRCYDLLGDEGNAALFLDAAVKEDEKYAMTHYYIGQFWQRKGEVARAQQAFDRAKALYSGLKAGKTGQAGER